MKQARKLFALLLTLTLVLSLFTVGAFAAGDDGSAKAGSITINNSTSDGSSYKIYKLFDVTTEGGNLVYFYTTTGESDAFLTALKDDSSPFTVVATTTENKYNVYLKDGKAESDVVDWLDQTKDSKVTLPTPLEKTIDIENGTGTYSNLDYGYYYITTSNGTLVSLDSLTGGTKTVQDKQTTPSKPPVDPEDPTKGSSYKVVYEVDEDGNVTNRSTENSVNYGDTVHYILQINAVNYVGDEKVTEYRAHDVAGAGLENVTVTKVTVGNAELSSDKYSVLTSTTDPAADTGDTITVVIPWVDKGEDDSVDYDDTLLYANNSRISIYVEATVGENATIGEDENSNLTNQASFTWKQLGPADEDTEEEHPGKDEDVETSTVTSYTYALAINKLKSDGTGLAGATFALTDAEGNDVYVKASTEDGVYLYDSSESSEGNQKSNKVVSPTGGLIIIKGLKAGTYTLTETAAPAGYILAEPFTIEAQKNTEIKYTTTKITVYTKDGKVVDEQTTESTKTETTTPVPVAYKNVVNYTGTELPSTGGMGTTIFYILGGVLVLAAVVLLVTKKRMSAER